MAPFRYSSTSDDNLADILQGILIEGIAVGEASNLQVDGLLMVVLGLVGADLALHVQSTNLAADAVNSLPIVREYVYLKCL